MIVNKSFPTCQGKKFVNLDMDIFWQEMQKAKDEGRGNVEMFTEDALKAACNNIDEDGEPLRFWVEIKASA